jgi:hypothetical protein
MKNNIQVDLYEKAAVYYRTNAVCEAYERLCDKPGMKKYEFTNSPFDIAVIQAATDDNPTLVPDVVARNFSYPTLWYI